MEEFKYIRELFTSMKEVFSKPVLIMPFVYMFIFTMAFLYFTPQLPSLEKNTAPEATILTSKIVLSSIFIAFTLLFYSMGLVGLRKYSDKEEVVRGDQLKGVALFGKLVLQHLYLFMIFGLPLIGLFLLNEIVAKAANPVLEGWVKTLMFIAYVIYFIAMALFYLFSPAIIAYDGKRPIVSLQESYALFRKDVPHYVLTFFSYLLFFAIMLIPISIGAALLASIVSEANIKFWVMLLVIFVVILFIVPAVVLYRFKAYRYGLAYVSALPDNPTQTPEVQENVKPTDNILASSSLTSVLDKKQVEQKADVPRAVKIEQKSEMQIQKAESKDVAILPVEKQMKTAILEKKEVGIPSQEKSPPKIMAKPAINSINSRQSESVQGKSTIAPSLAKTPLRQAVVTKSAVVRSVATKPQTTPKTQARSLAKFPTKKPTVKTKAKSKKK